MAFNVEIVRARDVTFLCCRGRLVVEQGAPLLRRVALRELSRPQVLALDLRSVTQIDARGAGVLGALCLAARQAGRRLVLADASARVLRVLRLTRLDTALPLLYDLPDRRESHGMPTGIAS